MANRSHTAWHRFLLALDPDPREAARCYRELRTRLVAMFRRRGLSAAEDLADDSIDRTVARLAAGDPIRSVPGYVVGVARRLALEQRRVALRVASIDHDALPAPDDRVSREGHAARLDSLDHVLGELPAATRELVLQYHGLGEPEHRARREHLAAGLGGLNALRIRMHRLRRELRRSIERRMTA